MGMVGGITVRSKDQSYRLSKCPIFLLITNIFYIHPNPAFLCFFIHGTQPMGDPSMGSTSLESHDYVGPEHPGLSGEIIDVFTGKLGTIADKPH